MTHNVPLPAPEGGWKDGTFYLVELAWNVNNPIHRAIFYSGFLHNGQPAASACLFKPAYEPPATWQAQLAYFNVLREVASKDEFWSTKGIRLVPGHTASINMDPDG